MRGTTSTKRKIMMALYECHRADAFCPVTSLSLIGMLDLTDKEEFLASLQDLHDEGYVEGHFLPYEQQGYIENARITPKGVDLVDNPPEFNKVFPE